MPTPLSKFLQLQRSIALFFVRQGFDTVLESCRSIYRLQGVEAEVSPPLPVTTELSGFGKGFGKHPQNLHIVAQLPESWTIIAHPFRVHLGAELDDVGRLTASLSAQSEILRVLTTSQLQPISCELLSSGASCERYEVATNLGQRCSLVSEFDDLAEEFGISMPDRSPHLFENWDAVVSSIGIPITGSTEITDPSSQASTVLPGQVQSAISFSRHPIT